MPQYASVFDTAEGNATFYGLPSAETVARWAAEAPETFRFCLKFPRVVTHDHALAGPTAATLSAGVTHSGGRTRPPFRSA